jgi:hypothetical protein
VLTCVDGALRDAASASCAASRAAVAALSQGGVPVVLVSHHDAADLRAIQEELGLHHPFIAGNGAALHVPPGYFSPAPGAANLLSPPGQADAWDVVEFAPPSITRAVGRLAAMYGGPGSKPLLVGIGVDRDHCALLRYVDVPIVVSHPNVDGAELRLLVPDAYVTTATGSVGWAEALLGLEPARVE